MKNCFGYSTSAPQAAIPQASPNLPVCPVCGGLECFCRPRFFAGQMLTEEDLNRLDHYIVAKNRLHNRYLHGWGVVCGLEVVCSPCDDKVLVKSGYALSPCGEDIILCANETVDICQLIQDCRRLTPPICDPPKPRGTEACPEVTEQWVLAIRYAERPSRGVMPLRGSSAPCCSRCNCGGSPTCGCSCHETARAATKAAGCSPSADAARTFQRTGLNQCEPTVTCESYAFEVYTPPEPPPPGAIAAYFQKCLDLEAISKLKPPFPDDPKQWQHWCCQLQENILDFLEGHPIDDCTALERLIGFECPASEDEEGAQYRARVIHMLASRTGNYLRYCACSALLPPCPEPVADPRVPLATITIRKRDCKILSICNWGQRRLALTVPSLQYWLSFLPFGRQLQELLAGLCCGQPVKMTPRVLTTAKVPVTQMATAKTDTSQDFLTSWFKSLATGGSPADFQTHFMAALGARDEAGNALISEDELRNPLQYLMLNHLVRPLAENLIPAEARGTLAAVAANLIKPAAGLDEQIKVVADLKSQVAELWKTVKQQHTKLNKLMKAQPK